MLLGFFGRECDSRRLHHFIFRTQHFEHNTSLCHRWGSGGKIELGWHATRAPTSGYFQLIRNLAVLISLAVVFSGSFALSTQSVEAKTSGNSSSRARNYLVPPPPPYTPTLIPSAPGMTNAQAVSADVNDAVVEKPGSPYSKYTSTRNQGNIPHGVQPNPYASYNPAVEKGILRHIDSFDSEISGVQKEISKLLNL